MTVSRYKNLYGYWRRNETIDLAKTEDRGAISEIQQILNDKGFNAGAIDGIAGPQTLKALERAKDYLNLQYPTLVGKFTIQRLIEMAPLMEYFKPTNGEGVLTSPYGWRVHPVHGGRRFHRGVDIGAPMGAKVHAVASGSVNTLVGSCKGENNSCGGGFGNYIRITHDKARDFSETLYAHLSRINVRYGQPVLAGDVIGYVGSTGRSTGPHLHFETWKNGNAINPTDVMDVI